ncbi:Lrp/AsnC family transcriptional regulator [uncultured Kiloniella sp.]|uniref:Lrp/AsnC family transcriptional regulator n=1 Tax=uncultured Kiloniella sp. TaxID=1133091 RepID=UPI00263614F0|nr:Lrp/AsnC family transcriptional regulator [uncultured Kiloniella sp.]
MDTKDQKLLLLLRQNARASIKELAAGIDLSRTALVERIKRLEKDGEITGYTLKPTNKKTKIRLYLMVKTHLPSCEIIAPRLERIPSVTACHSLGGSIDMVIELALETTQEANEIRELVSNYPEVSEVSTSTILKTHFQK